uniref:Cilia- and flagella-associated protein 97 n=1 Tax=Oryzias latipes TaxID=8090 RepID=A0A3P9JPV6_ORYLA
MFNSVGLEGEVDHSFFDSGSDGSDGEPGVEKSLKAKKQSLGRQKKTTTKSNEKADDEDSSQAEKTEGSELLSKKPSRAFMSLLADTTEGESVSQSPNEIEEKEEEEEDSYRNLDKYSLSLESSLEYQLALNCRRKSQRKNFSFSKDEVRRIERENQRLLQKLTHLSSDSNQKRAVKKSTSVAMNSPVSRLSHSALNRQREQQRIQRENLALLKKLETVKPTPDLKRSKQLADYQRLAGYLRPEKAHPSLHIYRSVSNERPSNSSSSASSGSRSVSSRATVSETTTLEAPTTVHTMQPRNPDAKNIALLKPVRK